MQIQRAGVDEVLATLRSCRDGLTHEEAARRLAEYGPNQVERIVHATLVGRFGAELVHVFADIGIAMG